MLLLALRKLYKILDRLVSNSAKSNTKCSRACKARFPKEFSDYI